MTVTSNLDLHTTKHDRKMTARDQTPNDHFSSTFNAPGFATRTRHRSNLCRCRSVLFCQTCPWIKGMPCVTSRTGVPSNSPSPGGHNMERTGSRGKTQLTDADQSADTGSVRHHLHTPLLHATPNPFSAQRGCEGQILTTELVANNKILSEKRTTQNAET